MTIPLADHSITNHNDTCRKDLVSVGNLNSVIVCMAGISCRSTLQSVVPATQTSLSLKS